MQAEKQSTCNTQLNLIEIFKSIQGETSFSGLLTTFIRLAACNLRCSWCDTSYSFGRGETYYIDQIITLVQNYKCKHVCITGGEPLLQQEVYLLMSKLCDLGYTVSLETSGSVFIRNVDLRVHVILDVKCPGSGMNDKNDWRNLNELRAKDEIKFVIKNREDYLFARSTCEKYDLFSRTKSVLFSPVYAVLDPKDLVHWILDDNLPVRLNLQIHKFIWSPEKQGV
jgi:7-carboxy-7-deazaguanine synthase